MTSMPVPEAPKTTRKRKRKTIDPTWPKLLVEIHDKVELMDKLQTERDKVAAKVDDLVQEAVDEGERYRDIATAAGRSVPWVQTVLRRLGVEGPRVRIMTTRAAAARRMDEEEAAARKARRKRSALDDLMP
jgi:coenzyme F420-reducing hydrogenase delta subunit